MRKTLRNSAIILILMITMGSFVIFCTPATACDHVRRTCDNGLGDSDAGKFIVDQAMKLCEKVLEDSNQLVLGCIDLIDECEIFGENSISNRIQNCIDKYETD